MTGSSERFYIGRHRWTPAADQWAIRLYINKTNLPHTAKPKHLRPEEGSQP